MGGAIRDAWLGRLPHDLDLAVPADQLETVALRLAEGVHGRIVYLTGGRASLVRVITSHGRVDLTPWTGAALEAELARRDLTIHAIALELGSNRLLDPYGGLKDLAAKRLRPPRTDAFQEDPVRVLRLARFEVQLAGFRATAKTQTLAQGAARELERVAGERIREELHRIASLNQPYASNQALIRSGAFPRLWGQASKSFAARSLLTSSRRLERLREVLPKGPLLDSFGLEQALRFGAIGTERTAWLEILNVWFKAQRLARAEFRRLSHWLTLWGKRPSSRADLGEWIYRLGRSWREGFLVAASLDRARPVTRWQQTLKRAADLANREAENLFARRTLIPAREVAELLEIPEGPGLGPWVEKLRIAYARGEIQTPESARRFLLRLRPELPVATGVFHAHPQPETNR